MRGRRAIAPLVATGLALVAAHALPAHAVQRGQRAQQTKPFHTAGNLAVREQTKVSWNQVPPGREFAWARFLSKVDPSAPGQIASGWQASWDRATKVPSRIFGRGLDAPGSVAHRAAAERFARRFLADHLALLAPGSTPGDFQLVSNVVHRGQRVVGFRQFHDGIEVLGGQVSFRFKNDRLFVIASEALPHVGLGKHQRSGAPRVGVEAAKQFARSWILTDVAAVAAARGVEGPFILPLVGDSGVLGYRLVHRTDVAADAPLGRFWVYTDATTGAPVARRDRLLNADGTVRFNVPTRYPGGGRDAYPAPDASFTIAGTDAPSDPDGLVTWSGDDTVDLVVRPLGTQVAVNNLDGNRAQETFAVAPGGEVVWDRADDELIDAQLTAFIHAGVVKQFAREHLAPDLEWLSTPLPVNVNIQDRCNAFSDGDSINFFQSSGQCENTALLADVVYHEFGHALHIHSIIEGAGAFDSAHSEGLSDYLAATITGDSGMGRGFFYDDGPLRQIDPGDREHIWPRDVGEVHYTGLIFAGAMWDLRKLMVTKYGEVDGAALSDRLFYATLRTATNIPSTYVEVLAEDDDDGDLANGTPNLCDINAAFGSHGLRAINATFSPLAAEIAGEDGFPLSVTVSGIAKQCPGDGVSGAKVEWYLRGEDPDTAQTIELTEGEEDTFSGTIPTVPDGSVVRYSVAVDFQDGSARTFPDNPADPRYEFYVGEVTPLYCTDFETDPIVEGWSHELVSGAPDQGADDWMWGPPMSPDSAGDPSAAFSGDNVFGTDLGGADFNGFYQPDKSTRATSPTIDVGSYSDVRLQYWRWLTVEDGFFDQATIRANGKVAWSNFNSNQGDSSSMQHTDREWRFHDVPLSHLFTGSMLTVDFNLTTDPGLEFGGWTMDDFCIVANPNARCGDGAVTGIESCDDGEGNSDTTPDSCRENCQAARCGDGVIDSNETCDDGNTVGGDGCSIICQSDFADDGDCGCEVAPRRSTPGLLALSLFGLAIVLVRRRRRPTHS